MLLSALWQLLEDEVLDAEAPPRMFNPYRDCHPDYDQPGAPAIRRENLRRYLAHYDASPPLLLVAEAPGPWGCRFSGVPLVSEAKLADPAFPLSGQASSRNGEPHREYSAGIYWRVMQPYFPQFFTWNAVPFHPHQAGEPLSIRNPTRREVAAFEDVLAAMVDLLQPTCTVAVGRKAERALEAVGATCIYVRHPSQGGARKFEQGMEHIFRETGLAQAPAAS